MREERTLPQKLLQFRHHKNNAGLTLLEISMGLLIMLILVAVTAPRMASLEASAERDTIKDFVPRLYTAAAIYESRYGFKPNSFYDFVTNGPSFNGGPYTITTYGLSTRSPNNQFACRNYGSILFCPSAFNKWAYVYYTFADFNNYNTTRNQYQLYTYYGLPYPINTNTETF